MNYFVGLYEPCTIDGVDSPIPIYKYARPRFQIFDDSEIVNQVASVAMEKEDPNSYLILLYPKFYEVSPVAQKVILYHEIGHYQLGHVYIPYWKTELNNVLRRLPCIFRHIPDEYEADAFAAKHVGIQQTILALKESSKLVDFDRNAVAEFRKRIRMLERMKEHG